MAYSCRTNVFIELYHFMKKIDTVEKYINLSKTFLNQCESTGFCKLKRPCARVNSKCLTQLNNSILC